MGFSHYMLMRKHHSKQVKDYSQRALTNRPTGVISQPFKQSLLSDTFAQQLHTNGVTWYICSSVLGFFSLAISGLTVDSMTEIFDIIIISPTMILCSFIYFSF